PYPTLFRSLGAGEGAGRDRYAFNVERPLCGDGDGRSGASRRRRTGRAAAGGGAPSGDLALLPRTAVREDAPGRFGLGRARPGRRLSPGAGGGSRDGGGDN